MFGCVCQRQEAESELWSLNSVEGNNADRGYIGSPQSSPHWNNIMYQGCGIGPGDSTKCG